MPRSFFPHVRKRGVAELKCGRVGQGSQRRRQRCPGDAVFLEQIP